MADLPEIPEDILLAGRRVYDALGRGSISDSERIARAILAERERCAQRIKDLTDALAESDRQAEKLEALLEPHIEWKDIEAGP